MIQNSTNFTINTGEPRHVYGHAVSGGIAVGTISSIKNSNLVKEKKIDKKEAIRNTLKDTLVGSIATATAVSVANDLGNPQKSLFQTLGSLAIGIGAIYTIEKGANKINKKEGIDE